MTIKKIFILPLMIITMMVFVVVPKTVKAITPTDTYYGHQWYLKRIAAFKAWDKVKQTDKIVVAVIDSGVQINHPDLRNNIWTNPLEIPGNGKDDDHNGYIDDLHGWDFVNNTANPEPKFKPGYTENGITHGTVVAGIIAAEGNNKQGIAGISWHTKIMPLKVLDDSGKGSTFKIIKAINYAVDNKADIINLSFVGVKYNKSLEAAIRKAYHAGVIIVAAGGNEAGQGYGNFLDKNPMYPVCHDGSKKENMVIGVAATGPLDKKTSFSGYGRCIDISAPGISIFSTTVYAPNKSKLFDKYYDGYWSGTSLAVPIISGTIALIKQANPKLNSSEIKEVLFSTADNINLINPQFINRLGVGRVNVSSAVEIAEAKLKTNRFGILVATTEQETTKLKLFNPDGQEISSLNNWGKYNFVTGNLNNDKRGEIVTINRYGIPGIYIYNIHGRLIRKLNLNLSNQASLAIGDTNHDGKNEIIIGAGIGAKPKVSVFNLNGELLSTWLAYAPGFKGGVNVTTGDINNNGYAEIITSPMSDGGPHIRIFNQNGKILGQFFANNKKIRNGFKVAVGNVFVNTRQEGTDIVVIPSAGRSPYIRIFNHFGKLKRKFAVYSTKFIGGVELSVADINNDGLDEIITIPSKGNDSKIKIFKGNGLLLNSFLINKKNKNNFQKISLATILLK